MAYDPGLLQRVREALDDQPGITEKVMFGGVAFLLRGKMFVGMATDDLMVRVGPAGHEAALRKPHVRPMDFTGRPMKGYVYVSQEGLRSDAALAEWVRTGLEFVGTLPEKGARAEPKAKAKPAKKSAKRKAS